MFLRRLPTTHAMARRAAARVPRRGGSPPKPDQKQADNGVQELIKKLKQMEEQEIQEHAMYCMYFLIFLILLYGLIVDCLLAFSFPSHIHYRHTL